jgi:hypothetical protein
MALKMVEGGGKKFLALAQNVNNTVKGHFLRIEKSKSQDYPNSKNIVIRLSSPGKFHIAVKGGTSKEEQLDAGSVIAFDFFGQLRYALEESGATPGTYVEFTYLGKDMKKKIQGKNPHQCTFGADLENTIEVVAESPEADTPTTATNIEAFKKSKSIA